MPLTTEKIERDRATAFKAGFARYLHKHAIEHMVKVAEAGGDPRLTKVGINPLLMAAVLPAAASYVGGRAAGNIGGTAYGLATDTSPETVAEREYDLASAETQRLIEELKAQQHNRRIREAMEGGGKQAPASSGVVDWLA